MTGRNRLITDSVWGGIALFTVLLLLVAPRSVGAVGTTFTVTNTNDSGAGSLRQAILDANANAGADTINFDIGTGVQTITPTTALPVVTETVTINGTTQPGYSGSPLIELNGSSAGPGAKGIFLSATTDSVIRGLIINRFGVAGIWFQGGSGHAVQGCYVGTDVSGNAARPNGTGADWGPGGIYVADSANNTIGGSNAGMGNLISGNAHAGIVLAGPGSTGNSLKGNLVGTTVAGSASLANGTDGVNIYQAASNTIGGTNPGDRNIISGNGNYGIAINNGGHGNTIQGNYIGCDVTGHTAIPNTWSGIAGFSSPNNLIGGTAAGAGNLLSGNGEAGVFFDALASTGNRVEGNLIGTDVSGLSSLGNSTFGVAIHAASGNTIGGASPAHRNVISSNFTGIGISGDTGAGNLVQGNYVGTGSDGSTSLGNSWAGVQCDASNNTFSGNVLSSNGGPGLASFGGSGNRVVGNFIGTDSTGTIAVGNHDHGIGLWSPASSMQVGGTDIADRNIISGNSQSGINLNDGVSGIVIQGNYIGTDFSGKVALANVVNGIGATNSANNLVGGSVPGAGNVISGNSYVGVFFYGPNASGNVVRGNLIGTDDTGTAAIPNFVAVNLIAPGNTIGGTSSADRNVISGNTGGGGVNVGGPDAHDNLVQGNYIGVGANGTTPLGNIWGVAFFGGAWSNTVGGTATGAKNVIAQNSGFGVVMHDQGGGNAILGNSIRANGGPGIDFYGDGPTLNDVGDTDAGPNTLQNFPVLTSAYTSAGTTTIKGALDSTPSTQFRVEFFSSPTADPSGYGEGETYLGSALVTTSASGTVNFTANVPIAVAGGHRVTATATDPNGNTSEFSGAFTSTGPAETTPPSITLTGTGLNGSGKTYVQFSVRDTGTGLASITMTETTNCTIVIAPFVPGTTAPVLVTATKVNQSAASRVALRAVDCAGNAAVGDPVIANLQIKKGKQLTRNFPGLPAAEHFVTLRNGSPGLLEVLIKVNGKRFRMLLSSSENRTLDVASATRPGRRNNFNVTATGPKGASAVLLIGDETLAGSMASPMSFPPNINFEWGR